MKGRLKRMPLLKKQTYTSADYWALPDGQRAELINGKLYAMAPPTLTHQRLVAKFTQLLSSYIDSHAGQCMVIPAPFAVNLLADDDIWVEPDISVICDPDKLSEKGCSGAPDLIIEIVSPTNGKMDYVTKNALYSDAGVREYWIVDPQKRAVVVYHHEKEAAPAFYSFETPVEAKIFPGFRTTVSELLK